MGTFLDNEPLDSHAVEAAIASPGSPSEWDDATDRNQDKKEHVGIK